MGILWDQSPGWNLHCCSPSLFVDRSMCTHVHTVDQMTLLICKLLSKAALLLGLELHCTGHKGFTKQRQQRLNCPSATLKIAYLYCDKAISYISLSLFYRTEFWQRWQGNTMAPSCYKMDFCVSVPWDSGSGGSIWHSEPILDSNPRQ